MNECAGESTVNLSLRPETNIVLIGMPWSGKSSVGVVLAKMLARPFLDTDIAIQTGEGRMLQTIIDREGSDALQRIEERYVLGLECRGYVIATGGSVVYSAAAMQHLKTNGCCVYLQLPYPALEARATDIDHRGIVRASGQGLADLYAARIPLYQRYADITVQCDGLNHAETLDALMRAVKTIL
ncbi:MAG TPA: shikimate kinase [Candidatus Hydrogenedentes bacterium]|nr:shikimate kinase [Candidatus Hydrogenedentota bacterium]